VGRPGECFGGGERFGSAFVEKLAEREDYIGGCFGA
jgi:hypothetical protein